MYTQVPSGYAEVQGQVTSGDLAWYLACVCGRRSVSEMLPVLLWGDGGVFAHVLGEFSTCWAPVSAQRGGERGFCLLI